MLRFAGLGLATLTALLAAALVTSLTVDLGPALRALAERGGSSLLKRSIHIGALKLQLFRGRVQLDDLMVEGLAPSDRPFFIAKQLSLSLDWSRMASTRPELIITAVEMADWRMLVEKFPDGDNFPRFRDENSAPAGPRRFTSTVRYLRGVRGQFAYEDH